MTLTPGTRLGPYEVLSPLGAGGMGEVYRARDGRLQREVAVKVLPESLAKDAGALARFEREALAVAALSHPNILAIHDYGSQDGVAYAVTELLAGETLRARLEAGPLPHEQAVDWAVQVARGLAAAHEKGIVHRDLKPDNLFVTNDGFVKILDFGLAKQEVEPARGAELNAATASVIPGFHGARTEPGMVLGTLDYMSPEQVRGEPADYRSDVFSFGAVLYEMLTGRKAFHRDTMAETMAAIMRDEPAFPVALPPALTVVVARCLEKRREARFESGRELLLSLAQTMSGVMPSGLLSTAVAAAGPTAAAPAPLPRRRRRLVLLGAGLALAAFAAVAALVATHRPPARPADARKRIAVLPFENLGPAAEDYFADGVSDEVRGKLTSLSSLVVIARGSSMPYKKTAKTLREIAEELDVTYLLTGTVRWEKSSDGGRVQVTPELVEVDREGAPESRWQQRFEANLTDVFAVQADIAEQVASRLGVVLGGAEKERLAEKPTGNLDAYDAFLRGEEASDDLSRSDGPSLQRALGHYEQAVALDPSFALAWASLSRARSLLYANTPPTAERAAAARAAAEKALALAPGRAAGDIAMGSYERLVRSDYRRALGAFEKARRREPSSAVALAGCAISEMGLGHWEAAVQGLHDAIRADPRSVNPRRRLGWTLLMLHRLAEARDAYDRALLLAPANLSVIEERAMASLAAGDLAGARAVIANVPKTVDPKALVTVFAEYYELGWVLEPEQRRLLLSLTPADFGDDSGSWALAMALEYVQEGNAAKVRELASQAADDFRAQLAGTPGNAESHSLLGFALALAGRKDEAIREAIRGTELDPVARDAYSGPYYLHILARVYLFAGEQDRAIDTLERLLHTPYFLTRAWLGIDPTFAPLRDNPRFQELLAGS